MTDATPALTLTNDELAGKHPYRRPKDAATLLILDRANAPSGALPRVLMGRRHMKHTFMPGKFVFPGGRLDPSDSRLHPLQTYHPAVEAKLSQDLKGPRSAARVRALGLAALRETYEEAGLLLGTRSEASLRPFRGFEAFAQYGVALSLEPLRFIGRAITPPNRSRRFDTRFLAVDSKAIAHRLPEGTGPSGELEDLAWLPLDEARDMDSLPTITRQILADLIERLCVDPDLAPDHPVPFYQYRGDRFLRELL
ncbi:NUDIX hydrolase [Roseibium aestuarii]|uniref:NUDIX hydrolase n=1 Tax=Roseibium aestuarii TaxID=2600299 RepID=A0ABW4K1G0_9HYPH|nr:NUDIX hydrolase [Roseibium aestuarii]